MSCIGRKGIHYLKKLNSPNVASAMLENGQNRIVDASLTLIRERAKLQVFIYVFMLRLWYYILFVFGIWWCKFVDFVGK